MKKKTIVAMMLFVCVFASAITVNAVSSKGITIAYNSMQGVTHDTINGDFHTSIYPTAKTSGTIEVQNVIYRKNILGQPKDKKTVTFYINTINKSYIFNTNYSTKAWTKAEWWNETSGSSVTGNIYLVNGHDTGA